MQTACVPSLPNVLHGLLSAPLLKRVISATFMKRVTSAIYILVFAENINAFKEIVAVSINGIYFVLI